MGVKLRGEMLTPKELAARWGKTTGTLATWRWRKCGPPFLTIGRAVLYALADVERHEKAHPDLLRGNVRAIL